MLGEKNSDGAPSLNWENVGTLKTILFHYTTWELVLF